MKLDELKKGDTVVFTRPGRDGLESKIETVSRTTKTLVVVKRDGRETKFSKETRLHANPFASGYGWKIALWLFGERVFHLVEPDEIPAFLVAEVERKRREKLIMSVAMLRYNTWALFPEETLQAIAQAAEELKRPQPVRGDA